MRETESLHLKRLERILFTALAGTPAWLREARYNCENRYNKIQLTDQFKAAISAFDDDNQKPFELFVLGEGKFGKSTIVNCLLGQELSKVKGLPETRCFHRYVFKDNPSDYTTLFLRTKPVVHDWLISKLGNGKPVKELFEILEYQAPHELANQLVAQDVLKQENGDYEQAIYEIERDIKTNDSSHFKREIRIVDTQGLDQIFPDDIKSSIQLNVGNSRESCRDWMRDTPRGLHLDWQFRRCDAVLWCINSKRLGSAATLEYLNYFSDYSKKIVIALTHIDIAKNEKQRDRLMAKAREKYSQYSDTIIPVNGKAAWESIFTRDQVGYGESGMSSLVDNLVDICDRDGERVRNVSRYKGLRQTEKQYRNALDILRCDYILLEAKHCKDLELVKNNQDKTMKKILLIVKNKSLKIGKEMLREVDKITVKDDLNAIEHKLKINSKSRIFRDYIFYALQEFLLPEVNSLNDRIAPYQIPSFDANGERAGHIMSHYVDALQIDIKIALPTPQLKISSILVRLADMFDSILIFSDDAKIRKRQRVIDLQKRIHDKLDEAWQRFLKDVEDIIVKESDRQYENLLDSIHKVMDKITRDAGDTLPQTINKIESSLSGVAVPNIFISKLLKTFKNEYCMDSMI